MAVDRTLSNPTIELNDAVIAIKPNSLSYKSGKGDIGIRAQSAGGNSISIVKTENAETKKGMVKFVLLTTKGNIDDVKNWQDTEDGNTIRFSDGDFNLAFRNMFIISDPEVMTGADGEVELEFEGLPAS